LRAATEQDSEFVFLVKKAALVEYIDQMWGWDEGFQREYHKKDYEPERTRIIVQDERDVGWMLVSETGTEITIQEIYLKPEHQSQGIGSYLIRQALEKAERQRKPVRLQVLKVNRRARQLYERLSFRTVGETEAYYLMSTGPFPAE
jgi:ribosomal protein S18 acetylase RimI-like enzyme